MSDSIKEAIEATNKKFGEYFAEGKAKAISELYTETPECMLMQPGSDVIKGRKGVEEALGKVMGPGITMTLNTLEVGPPDATDTAYERGASTITVKKDGIPTNTYGKYVAIWKKVDGTWYLYIDIFNDNQ